MWLSLVFTVLGGYALATGILAVTLAATAFRSRHPVAAAGTMVAGASSIGLMSVVNFMIGSDFKWALLACALVWALSLVVYGFESCASAARGRGGRQSPFVHPRRNPTEGVAGALDQPGAGLCETRDIARTHLDAVRTKLAELQALERRLESFVKSCTLACAGGPGPDCVIFKDLATPPLPARGGCC